MTVLETIQKSGDFLSKKGVDSPRLQAELLLAHVLKLPRMKLYLNFERSLSEPETDAMREFVKRRGQREPLQHIVGSTSFCGFEIAVNRHVLVPRPETELLTEAGWEFLNHLSAGVVPRRPVSSGEEDGASQSSALREEELSALDFGTGSGCIAIALAAKCPESKILALDVSEEALAVAKGNAGQNGVGERIDFLCGDGFAALASDVRFNLIISNPPYIPSEEIATLQPEVRDFDPRNALDGGSDGLDFYRMLACRAASFLKPGGKIMVEFGDGQAGAIQKILTEQKWIVEGVRDDYSQRQRILIARI